jgi:hypothetical protein
MKSWAILIAIVIIALPAVVGAQGAAGLKIENMVFCTAVQDRQPVGADTAFADTVGTVYCFTRIVGGSDTSSVDHVWYFSDKEMTSVTLPVRSSSWRTWSAKRIGKGETGTWRVDVKSPSGEVLKSAEFVIKP